MNNNLILSTQVFEKAEEKEKPRSGQNRQLP